MVHSHRSNIGNFAWGLALIGISCVWAQFITPQASSMLSISPVGHEGKPISPGDALILEWRLLQKMPATATSPTDELKNFVGARVKIPGFAVPLTDNLAEVREFLLVPNQMACIHVPAPPPNLIIFVKLPHPLSIEEITGPIWITGLLSLQRMDSIYGAASWEMVDTKVEPYLF